MKHVLTFLLIACSCIVSAQSEYCLDGTVWDAALGGCVPEVLACEVEFDFDGDGSVGSGDLLAFLGGFGGTFPDADADGVCDEIDECVGEYDECGVCNGPGAVYECGCLECLQCGNPISYQGYDYATVLIGDQCWFAENLRSENYANGDSIPTGLSDSEWESTTSGGVAVYGEGLSTCQDYSPDGDPCDEAWSLNEYGRLYNWYAVDDFRGLCPYGWHVPTDVEWMTLEMALGMTAAEANDTGFRGTDQGIQMKTDYGWYGNGNGTNSSGFSGLPGGTREPNRFAGGGDVGMWWSSSSVGLEVWYRLLEYAVFDGEQVYRQKIPQKFVGTSVRCLKDTE